MKLNVYAREDNKVSRVPADIDAKGTFSMNTNDLMLTMQKDNLIELHKALGEFIQRKWPEQIKTANSNRREDCISPTRRPGYDTILGYLAKEQPEILSLLEGAEKDGTLRDGFWLTNKCRQLGYAVIKVRAPEILRNQGIDFVNAYPVSLLRERFEN